MIVVRLSPEIEARLEKLARETRRSKSFYVREALARYLNEREDALLDLARIEIGQEGSSDGRASWSASSGHARIDRRSLAMHRAVAEKLRKDPRLLEKARSNIRRWRRQGVDVRAFKEWEAILDKGIDEAVRIMCGESEESDRLRHSTPFTGILSPKERRVFFAKKPA